MYPAVTYTGFGGFNSRWARIIANEVFKGRDGSNTGLVTVFFGGNDAAIPMPNGNEWDCYSYGVMRLWVIWSEIIIHMDYGVSTQIEALDQIPWWSIPFEEDWLMMTGWLMTDIFFLSSRWAARRHVPVAEYKENLKAIVAGLRSQGVTTIVLVTPPPIYEPMRRSAMIRVWYHMK
jgi:hypothetical protein